MLPWLHLPVSSSSFPVDINLTTNGVLDKDRQADMNALSLAELLTDRPIKTPNNTVTDIIMKLPTVAMRKTWKERYTIKTEYHRKSVTGTAECCFHTYEHFCMRWRSGKALVSWSEDRGFDTRPGRHFVSPTGRTGSSVALYEQLLEFPWKVSGA